MISKTQIDRLGGRLRSGTITPADIRMLDDYRRSFAEAYETVVRTAREQLGLKPTGRPAKSTSSIIEKLQRESIRLSQIQDIAGCRVVVADVLTQDRTVDSLRGIFARASVVDRRGNPSYGYRAVHVIVTTSDKFIEVQVRTRLQHLWAELSEKLSDLTDPAVKYGGGSAQIRDFLDRASNMVEHHEVSERQFALITEIASTKDQITDWRREQEARRNDLLQVFTEIANGLNSIERYP